MLRDCLERYRAGRWDHDAARIRVALWLVRGGRAPRALMDFCRRRGWALELKWLEGRTTRGYYPLHAL